MLPLASLRDFELDLLHRVTCDWATPLVEGLVPLLDDAFFGAGVVIVLLLVVSLKPHGRARAVTGVLTLLVTLGAAHGVREVLWRTLPRDRPGNAFREDQILRGPIDTKTCASRPEMWVERAHPPKSPSFPSSHVVTIASCAVGLWVAARWAGAIGWVYAVLVGYGRMYQGKHWPSDVLGSLLLVAGIGWVAARVVRRWQARRAARSAGEDVRPAGEPPRSPSVAE